MTREEVRRMFAKLSADLAHVTADFPEKILCPLCLTPMPEEWIDLKLITAEHIIPEKLGGHIFTLTCKNCNSTHGAELDSHLIQMVRSHDSLAGVGTKPLYGRMQLDGKSLPIDIHPNAATRTIGLNMRRGHPAVPEQVRQFFRNNPATPDNPVTIPFEGTLGYARCRVDIALLRIGYLAMFKQLGYRYILSPAADVIKRIIMGYENPPAELGRIILGSVLPAPTGPLQFVRLKGDVAILVVMTLIADSKPYYYGVVMPSPGLEPGEVFPALRDAAAALHKRRSGVGGG